MNNLILLVGPQGSGKSTHCITSLPTYTRISQDDKGASKHWVDFCKAVNNKEDIVVDRINHLRYQREKYIKVAKDAGYSTEIRVMHLPYYICFDNIINREKHPTLPKGNKEKAKKAYVEKI